MGNQSEANEVIDTIINSTSKTPSKEEAAKILRSCGILDEHNNINPAYQEIFKNVESVVYGEWKKVYQNDIAIVYECTNCKHLTFGTSCHCICGAKMNMECES